MPTTTTTTPSPNPHRWVMLSMFCVPSMVNGSMFLTMGAISDIVEERFDVSAGFVNGCGQAFYITFLLSLLPGLAVLNRPGGLRQATIMAGVLNTVGAGLRIPSVYVEDPHFGFAFVLVSNVVAAGSQAYFLTVPTLLSAEWFPEAERGVSTAIAGLVNQLGMAAGYFVSRFFVTEENFDVAMGRINIITTAVIAATTLLIFTFFKSGPNTTPHSDTPTHLIEVAQYVVTKTRSTLTPPLTLFFAIFGVNTAVYWSTGLLLDSCMLDGYSSTQIAIAGTLYFAAGIPGMWLGGVFLDWTNRLHHKKVILGCLGGAAVLMCALSFSLWFEAPAWVCYGVCSVLGLSLGTSQPIFLDLGVLLTPSCSETISCSLLFLFATQTGFFLVFIGTFLSIPYSAARAGFYNNLIYSSMLVVIMFALIITPCDPPVRVDTPPTPANELSMLIKADEPNTPSDV